MGIGLTITFKAGALDDDQSEEMGQIVSIINRTCSDTLQSVLKEAKE